MFGKPILKNFDTCLQPCYYNKNQAVNNKQTNKIFDASIQSIVDIEIYLTE